MSQKKDEFDFPPQSLPPSFLLSLPLISCLCFLLWEPAKVRKPEMATSVASWGHTQNAAGC